MSKRAEVWTREIDGHLHRVVAGDIGEDGRERRIWYVDGETVAEKRGRRGVLRNKMVGRVIIDELLDPRRVKFRRHTSLCGWFTAAPVYLLPVPGSEVDLAYRGILEQPRRYVAVSTVWRAATGVVVTAVMWVFQAVGVDDAWSNGDDPLLMAAGLMVSFGGLGFLSGWLWVRRLRTLPLGALPADLSQGAETTGVADPVQVWTGWAGGRRHRVEVVPFSWSGPEPRLVWYVDGEVMASEHADSMFRDEPGIGVLDVGSKRATVRVREGEVVDLLPELESPADRAWRRIHAQPRRYVTIRTGVGLLWAVGAGTAAVAMGWFVGQEALAGILAAVVGVLITRAHLRSAASTVERLESLVSRVDVAARHRGSIAD